MKRTMSGTSRRRRVLESVILAAIAGMLVGLIYYTQVFHEARRYNEATGASATVWDAIMNDLSTDNTPKSLKK